MKCVNTIQRESKKILKTTLTFIHLSGLPKSWLEFKHRLLYYLHSCEKKDKIFLMRLFPYPEYLAKSLSHVLSNEFAIAPLGGTKTLFGSLSGLILRPGFFLTRSSASKSSAIENQRACSTSSRQGLGGMFESTYAITPHIRLPVGRGLKSSLS